MTFFRTGSRGCSEMRQRLIQHLLTQERHNAPEIIEATGIKMTTVYGALRHMVQEGWLSEMRVPHSNRRDFVVTPTGRRGMQFLLELSTHDDDSRSSNPTAARNSS